MVFTDITMLEKSVNYFWQPTKNSLPVGVPTGITFHWQEIWKRNKNEKIKILIDIYCNILISQQ